MKPMYVRTLRQVRAEHRPEVGGKAAALAELLQAKHRVPDGFVVTTRAQQQLTPEVRAAILQHFDELGTDRVAVRSSGVAEDGTEQSWAGQFATFLHIQRSDLLDAVHSCWASANAARVAAYANGSATDDIAVLIQQMVHSEVAGVAFSVNPVTGDTNQIVVEAVYGLGELLVQGLGTPDNYLVDKTTDEVLASDIAEKLTMLTFQNGHTVEVAVDDAKQQAGALSTDQVREVAALATAIEMHYGFAVDIEWAYQDGQLFLLQARPITTL